MNNNDVLRRTRFALDESDARVLHFCQMVGVVVSPAELPGFLAKETDPWFVPCPDAVLGAFLDGLVLDRRGPRDPGLTSRPSDGRVNNNLILKKLRIALEFKEPEMLAVLARGGMVVTTAELGALFRSPGHKHYRPCGDQLLRNFLKGLTVERRGPLDNPDAADV